MNVNNDFNCTDQILEICNRYSIHYLIYGFILSISTIKTLPLIYLINWIMINIIDLFIKNNGIDLLTTNLYIIFGSSISFICYFIIIYGNKNIITIPIKELICNNWIFKNNNKDIDDDNNNNNNNEHQIQKDFIKNTKTSIIIGINFLISNYIFTISNIAFEDKFSEGVVITMMLLQVQFLINYIILSPNLNSFNIDSNIEKKNIIGFNFWFIFISFCFFYVFIGIFFLSNVLKILISMTIQAILSLIIRYLFF